MRELNIVVAVDVYGVFGDSTTNSIPWKDEPFAKADFKRFQSVTKNTICIMGFRTYQEILDMKIARGGDPTTPLLLDRECFVITNTPAEEYPESTAVTFVPSLRAAVERLSDDDAREVFVLGGQQLFVEALAWTKRIFMTIVRHEYVGDRIFPLDYVRKHFHITNGEQKPDLFFVEFTRS